MMIFLKECLYYANRHRETVICGILSLFAYAYLAWNSQSYAELSLLQLWAVCLPCALMSFYICWHYCQRPDKTFPTALMVGFAIAFRLLGINTFPILEDDFYRFLWDGYQSIHQGTPYGWVPADYFSSPELSDQFDDILGGINHPNVATIYGPLLQLLFATAYLIAPGEIWPLQAVFALADIGIILLLSRLAQTHYVLLYAWSPLIIKEFTISAHPDVLGAFFLVVSFYLYHRIFSARQPTTAPYQQWCYVSICLALAASVKIFAFILAPLLLRFRWQYWLVYFATLFVLALPFALQDPNQNLLAGLQAVWLPEGLKAMAGDWLFNAPIYYLAHQLLPIAHIKVILLGSFALYAAGYFFFLYLKRQALPIRIDILYGVFFICIPVLNPWYLVWLLPFAVIYPSRWAWVASLMILLAYASGINLPQISLETLQLYQQPPWIIGIEFSLIALALWLDSRRPLPAVRIQTNCG